MSKFDAEIPQSKFGISVGHASDTAGATGCTVVRGTTAHLRASAFAFGRATATREFALLDPWASNERVDAVLLTGGGIADSERQGYRRGFFVEPAANTTISLVMLNVAFSKVELHRIARAAGAAHARRIGPAGTSFDGDIIFAVASVEAKAPQPGDAIKGEIAATIALEEAIVRAVQTAKGRDGIPGLAD